MNALRTPLCGLLGIEHPIIQSGMGQVAGPDLVAEVSRAGGLGILAGLNLTADQLRDGIRRVRASTDRPFGVNLWLHADMRPPASPASVPEATIRAAQGQLNIFRGRLGLAPTQAAPRAVPDLVGAALETVLEERPPVFSSALGHLDAATVERFHTRGIKVIAMVTNVDDARAVAATGVDVIVAQGAEAGGHRSLGVKPPSSSVGRVGLVALLPEIVDAVGTPVVAAGGIADGRGLVAALALGACGILLGTRFVATRESTAPEMHKKRLLEADGDATTVTDVFSGLPARALANAFSREYTASGAPVLPVLLQRSAAGDVYAAAAAQGDPEYYPMMTGQSAGLIRDLPGAAEVVEGIVREARAVLARLGA
jgi:nitronate monooxygenase